MSKIEDFNERLDDYKYVVIPTKDVGYVKPDDNGTDWGNWHLDVSGALMCNKVSIHLED